MEPVTSGNIAAFGYDPDDQELYIEFNSGGLYIYQGVPSDVAEGLREAPSKGQYHSQFIKGVYPFERIG